MNGVMIVRPAGDSFRKRPKRVTTPANPCGHNAHGAGHDDGDHDEQDDDDDRRDETAVVHCLQTPLGGATTRVVPRTSTTVTCVCAGTPPGLVVTASHFSLNSRACAGMVLVSDWFERQRGLADEVVGRAGHGESWSKVARTRCGPALAARAACRAARLRRRRRPAPRPHPGTARRSSRRRHPARGTASRTPGYVFRVPPGPDRRGARPPTSR